MLGSVAKIFKTSESIGSQNKGKPCMKKQMETKQRLKK